MTKQSIGMLLQLGAAFLAARSALAAPGNPAAPTVARPVTWSASVAGPKRADLEQALDKPLANPWSMFDRKTGQRHEARSCRQLLALESTSDPMDVHDDGTPPSQLITNDWNIYGATIVGCRLTLAVQEARPARVDHVGGFPLDNAALKVIPAAVIPTPSYDEEALLKKASARGVSWKGWDRRIRVTKTSGKGVTVESPDTNCFLEIYGRGDFNDDGIEDVLLWRDGGGQEGTWNSTAGFILTRRSPRGRVEIIKVIE